MKDTGRIEAIIRPDDCLAFENYCKSKGVRFKLIGHFGDGMHIKVKLRDYIRAIENCAFAEVT